MERRRHNRICTSIPIKIQFKLPESPEVSWTTFGVLKNLSNEGAYFISHDPPTLELGQIREVTITSIEEHPNFPGGTFINGKSRVVRIDSPETCDHEIGVALEFISAKFFDLLFKSS
jgi:hypothetical protein